MDAALWVKRRNLLQKKVGKLVRDYGADWVRHAVNAYERDVAAAKPGRPGQFDMRRLMDLWLFVETGIHKSGLSVNKFCEKAVFRWYEARPDNEPQELYQVTGATLRRRYQEAKAFLSAEAAVCRLPAGFKSKRFSGLTEMSPTEEWWRRELAARLAHGS